MTCSDESGEALCVLECEDECPLEGEPRCDGDVMDVCARGESGCREWVPFLDCALESPPQVCEDADGMVACSLAAGVADDCASALRLERPAVVAGAAFGEDFTDALALTGPGCTGNAGQPEAVFTVDLAAGDELVAREVGGLGVTMSVQGACGAASACLATSAGFPEEVRYTAPVAQTVTLVVESTFLGGWTEYQIRVGTAEVCGDGLDNDLDDERDCADDECFGLPPCDVETICGDGRDNDLDGFVDCADDDCVPLAACQPYRGLVELFSGPPLDGVDVSGWTLVFEPDPAAPDGYVWSASAGVAGFPVEPGTGDETRRLSLGDDDSVEVSLAPMGSFELFGVSYATMHVGSNGYVTFGAADTSYSPSYDGFFTVPRVAAYFRDLDPRGGGVITVDGLADAVTFAGVPRFGGEDTVDFQILLEADGTIEIAYVEAPRLSGMIGVGAGPGVEPLPLEVDFVDVPEICDDGADNDADTLADCADPECSGIAGCPSETRCADHVDDDGDTLVDCLDPECFAAPECLPESACADSNDNDLDGLMDCADPDCWSVPPCDDETLCGNAVDDDHDGLADCADPDCVAVPGCEPVLGIWQSFDPAARFDLDGHTLTFVPDAAAANGYSWSVAAAAGLPETAGGGAPSTLLALEDDDAVEVPLTLLGSFDFFGAPYGSLHVGSNGLITFGAGVTHFEPTAVRLHAQPTIALLWDDLNPTAVGAVTVDEHADRVVVTFDGVPRYLGTDPNVFQAVLWADGTIELTWEETDVADVGALFVGIVDGTGAGGFSPVVDFRP
jgi:hypothetical protein